MACAVIQCLTRRVRSKPRMPQLRNAGKWTQVVREKLLQAVGGQAHLQHVGAAGALVAAQEARIAHAAPVVAGLDHVGERGRVGQAEVQALARERVHRVGGIARERPRLARLPGHRAGPAVGDGARERPGRALAREPERTERAVAGLGHRGVEFVVALREQRGGAQLVDRPHQRDRLAVRAAQRQQREHLALVVEPLARDAVVRLLGLQARRHRVLRIARDLVAHAQRLARGAGLAFAHHGERRGHGLGHDLDLGLEAHRVGQLLLERRHIDDPRERIDLLARRAELHAAAFVAMHQHLAHRGGVGRIGPGAQRFEEGAGGGVERVGADVLLALRGGRHHQRHAHAFACEQQGQRAADDAGAANANFWGEGHRTIVGVALRARSRAPARRGGGASGALGLPRGRSATGFRPADAPARAGRAR
jgi:hypothetical protein